MLKHSQYPFRSDRSAFGGLGRLWTPAVATIVTVCLAVFVVQRVLSATAPLDDVFAMMFGLSRNALAQGFFWQPFTYIFLHGSVLHLGLNLLVVLLFGSGLEAAVGTRRFWAIFLLSGVLGGLGWLALAPSPAAVCIGASGGVFGLIGAYAGLFPRRNITVLLFFVFPLTLQAWILALVLGLSSLFDLIVGGNTQTAYAAHLAGGLAGYLYGRMLGRPQAFSPKRPTANRVSQAIGHSALTTASAIRHWMSVFPPWRNGSRARMARWRGQPPAARPPSAPVYDLDDLLDKISRQGLSSLTPEEQAALHRHARCGLEGGAGRRDAP